MTTPNDKESFSFPNAEKEILSFWQKNNIFKKSLDATKEKKPYIFYDGPPFATGLPHHGHLLASTLKDIVPRYWTMKGYYVERRFGWDCHGLPIEHEIDKKLEMSAQDAVEKLGVKGYNSECRKIVDRYVNEWEETVNRIGRWVDFENDYKTMDTSFMESVWWVFKQLWEKNLIYQGTKVVPFSTALGTTLSNFEAGQNYQDVQDPSITVLFKLDDEDCYISAWTTTPWTLPSNLGLCVGPDIDYVKLHDQDKKINIIMAEDRVESYSKKHKIEVLSQFKGSDLKGKTYSPLFDYFINLKSKGAFQVHCDNYVTTDAGTGIVHLAPAFGEDDNRVMKEVGLSDVFVLPVDDHGRFDSSVKDFQGLYVKDADKEIIKKLKSESKLYEQSTLVHSYPFCYRSDTPLIYRAIPSWYVKVESIKDQLIESNQKINWIPGHIKDGRFGKWLEGARDWSISRNRVWGTPLPVWINDVTGKAICIGSVEELESLCKEKVTDLHREYVDAITFEIKGEQGTYKRITEVLDCWFESGSMPYAQLHYPFENKDLFEKGFPAEFIAEGLDQTRGWFYTLTILSTALFQRPAFKNVIVNGMVMAEDGKKMSKRLKNYTAPNELMETYGADALRLYLINSGLVKAEEHRFTDKGVKEMIRKVLLPWFNAFKFFSTYSEVDGWNRDQHFLESKNILDQWLVSSLQTLKKNVEREMKEYKLYLVVPALFNFIEDLTNWYIRLNRNRFWGEGLTEDKKEAYSTLFIVIDELTKTLAPFAPFLSEYIYRELQPFDHSDRNESVHLCSYPETQAEKINPKLESAVERLQQIILLGRQKRVQEKIKVKIPLSQMTIIHQNSDLLQEIAKLESYIKTELNIKKIVYENDEDNYINLYAKPNSPVLGKRLGKEFGKFRNRIESLSASELKDLEEQGTIIIDEMSFESNDILIFREAKPGTNTLSNRFISIDMQTELSQDLIDEGMAREIVNRIQKTRKEMDFNVSDRVSISFTGDERICKIIKNFQDHIGQETLASSFCEDQSLTNNKEAIEIEGLKLFIDLKLSS